MGNTHDAELSRLEADNIETKWLTSRDYRWGYTMDRGPDTWWMRYPSASGGMQSPIDVITEEAKKADSASSFDRLATSLLRVNYYGTRFPPAPSAFLTGAEGGGGRRGGGGGGGRSLLDGATAETVILTNTGNTLQLNVINSQSYITGGPCGEYCYVLDQVHIHWGEADDSGSEHLVNNQAYAAEIQLIHWNEDLFRCYEEAEKSEDGLVILTVFAQLSEENCNEALDEIGRLTEDIPYRNQNIPAKDILIKSLLPDVTHKFWTYEGSMTIPPCYETVTWVIFEKPTFVTSSVLEKFRRIRCYCDSEVRPMNDQFDGHVITNRRPVQPIGTRRVSYVDDTQLVVRCDHVRRRLQPFRERRSSAPAEDEALQDSDERRRDGALGRGRQRGCNRG